MAQNITLLGASYSDVPSILLPKTGGGTAQFDDTTIASNAASASDILSGKLAYVNGSLITGTGTGGGGSAGTITQDGNGYLVVSDQAGGGGGGLEYEEGTWYCDEDINKKEISFSNTHDTAPLFVMLADVSSTGLSDNDNIFCCIINYTSFYGPFVVGASNKYGLMPYGYAYSGGISENSIYFSSSTYMATYLTASSFKAYTGGSNRYWRAGRTYKWFAVWPPTT